MSTRHSFLSTTGLLRPPSSASLASTVPSIYSVQTEAPVKSTQTLSEKVSDKIPRMKNLKNLKKLRLPTETAKRFRGNAGLIPLGPTFIVGIAIIMSIFFIGALSFAFIGGEDAPVFQEILDNLAHNNPGVRYHIVI